MGQAQDFYDAKHCVKWRSTNDWSTSEYQKSVLSKHVSRHCSRCQQAERQKNVFTYASKAMERCGLKNQENGLWELRHTFPDLQGIVAKYREHFDGSNPDL